MYFSPARPISILCWYCPGPGTVTSIGGLCFRKTLVYLSLETPKVKENLLESIEVC